MKKTIYNDIMEAVAAQVAQALNEYNGSDAIEDAERSGYDSYSREYHNIMKNGRGGNSGHHAPDAGELHSAASLKLTFDKCFMSYDPASGSIMVYGYDDIFDLLDLYGIEDDDEFYQHIDELRVGQSATDKLTGAIHTRIK